MDIRYANNKVEKQCTDLKAATRFFGGDKNMAISLMSRINAIEQATVIKDIIVMPTFRFHQLKGKRKGYFAIDVKTIRDKWRIIVQPLDDEGHQVGAAHGNQRDDDHRIDQQPDQIA